MPDPTPKPVAAATPAPAATPAAPAAPVAAPAARTPSTPQPKPAKPSASAKPKAGGIRLSRPPKTISAKKALGEDVLKESAEVSKRQRENYDSKVKVTARYEAPAEEIETPVEAPAAAPAAPAAPAAAAPAVEAPKADTKVKVNGKEYTLSELEEIQRAHEEAQAATPAEFEAPTVPQEPPQPTAEELAQREAQFLEQTTNALEAPITEAEMDKILGGGKEAIDALSAIRKRDMATAILHARKGIAEGINPIVKSVFEALQPLVQQHQAVARHQIKTHFIERHKDFAPHIATCESVADELIRLYPQQVKKLSPEQFVDEVARQSDSLLKKEHLRWFPDKAGNWRSGGLTPAAAAAAPAPALQAAPVVDPTAQPAAAAPAAPAAPAPAAAPAVPPPASTLPGSQARMGKTSWQKSVAMRLRS